MTIGTKTLLNALAGGAVLWLMFGGWHELLRRQQIAAYARRSAHREPVLEHARSVESTEYATTDGGYARVLKKPYPTIRDMEQAIGEADFRQRETGTGSALPAAYWWGRTEQAHHLF
jgi:hypothetical protein